MIMDFDFASRTRGKRVQLMLTCICDAFFDDVGKSSVEALEFAGCEVEFPEGQTCCGQPAFNAGDWKSSRKVIRHVAKVFAGDLPVVVPSGSCAAMIFHGAKLAFEDEPDRGEIDQLGGRTWELCDYLVNGLGVTSWPGRVEKRVAFHRSCHSRGTPSVAAGYVVALPPFGLDPRILLVSSGWGPSPPLAACFCTEIQHSRSPRWKRHAPATLKPGSSPRCASRYTVFSFTFR